MQYQEVCSIPDDANFIAKELGCTPQEWAECRSEIMHEHRPLMKIITNRLFSKGLWEEHIKQQVRREHLRQNGLKGGRPKTKRLFLDNQKQSLSSPTPTPIPSLIPESEKNKSVPAARFVKPTALEVTEYAKSKGINLDGEIFCSFYESKGWMVGRNPMKSWKAAVTGTWKNGSNRGGSGNGSTADQRRLEKSNREFTENIKAPVL